MKKFRVENTQFNAQLTDSWQNMAIFENIYTKNEEN